MHETSIYVRYWYTPKAHLYMTFIIRKVAYNPGDPLHKIDELKADFFFYLISISMIQWCHNVLHIIKSKLSWYVKKIMIWVSTKTEST